MGLDITYYSGLEKVRAVESGYAYDDDLFRPLDNSHFPGRIGSLDDGWFYSAAHREGFRAGSYSGYNEWRRQLAALIGEPDINAYWERQDDANPQGPFSELLNFADNEGTIGPEVSAKLARDFAEHQAAADAHPDPWFRELYGTWRTAFETAADRGAVDFH